MKAQKTSKLLAVALSTAVLAVYGCGGGGGGGGGTAGPQPVTYSSPEQAASSAAVATSSLSLTESLSIIADTSGGYYAPKRSKKADTATIAKIDPRLKEVIEKMANQFQSPVFKGAVKKARATGISKAPIGPVTYYCDNVGGSFTISGSDNSDVTNRTYDEMTVTIVFSNCRDNTLYTELSGQLQVYAKTSPVGSTSPTDSTLNLTGTNLTVKQYSGTSFTEPPISTSVFNGSFNGHETYNSSTSTWSGTNSADATFTVTSSGGTATLNFSDLSDVWTSTHNADGSDTDIDTLNGSLSFAISGTGAQSFSLSFTFTNLQEKWHFTNDINGTEHLWLNGSIAINWDPDISGCLEGTITLTTADSTPLEFNNASPDCPVSGTLQVNNATIVYGTPITVTVGTLSTTFNSCAEMEMAGGMCMQ